MIPVAGFNQSLGMAPGPDGTVLLDADARHEVAPGVIHFAVLTTLAEVAAAGAAQAPVVPAQVSVQLLARAAPGRLEARGTVLRRGRRLLVAEGEVRQEGRLVAKATVTFAVLDAG
jgi:acyl-coenzyme A thioesterase PaaI-like protein